MNPAPAFVGFLLLTLALLAGVFVTGLRAQRRRHIPLVVCAVLSLAVTVYWAERLGELYDLSTAGAITPVHLALAKLCALSYLLPLATGLRTLKHPGTRPLHRKLAFLVLGLTVFTAVTGTWMVLAAERL